MNQSVISRMDLIYDMEAPDLNTMVKRVMNVTGFTDEQEATKMAIVVRDVAERCRQTMITDGSCGMREFKSWVLSTMVTHDPYESALSTIISSASADPDNRAELISACLEPQVLKNNLTKEVFIDESRRESFVRFAVAVALACYDLPADRAMTSDEAARLVKWVIDMALGPAASGVSLSLCGAIPPPGRCR